MRVAFNAQRSDAVLVSLDGRSAYDSMSRAAFLSKLREVAPELLPFTRMFYGRPSAYSWWDDAGRHREALPRDPGKGSARHSADACGRSIQTAALQGAGGRGHIHEVTHGSRQPLPLARMIQEVPRSGVLHNSVELSKRHLRVLATCCPWQSCKELLRRPLWQHLPQVPVCLMSRPGT